MLDVKAHFLAVALLVVSAAAPVCAETFDEDSRADWIEFCETALCRKPGFNIVTLEDGTRYLDEIDSPRPYAYHDIVRIMPGDRITVEFSFDDHRLIDIRAVDIVLNPERVLIFSFKQEGGIMWLDIENRSPMLIKYHAHMRVHDRNYWLETSSCPVKPDIPVTEIWPHPILEVRLHDFRVVDSDSEDAGLCIY